MTNFDKGATRLWDSADTARKTKNHKYKPVYETSGGAIDGDVLGKGFAVFQGPRGLRHGKHVDVVMLGKLYIAGVPTASIAETVGCDRRTISRWATKLGLRKTRKKRKRQ